MDKPLDFRSTAGADETMMNLTEGFTFTGGAATNGAGISYIGGGRSPRKLYSCVISNNHTACL